MQEEVPPAPASAATRPMPAVQGAGVQPGHSRSSSMAAELAHDRQVGGVRFRSSRRTREIDKGVVELVMVHPQRARIIWSPPVPWLLSTQYHQEKQILTMDMCPSHEHAMAAVASRSDPILGIFVQMCVRTHESVFNMVQADAYAHHAAHKVSGRPTQYVYVCV